MAGNTKEFKALLEKQLQQRGIAMLRPVFPKQPMNKDSESPDQSGLSASTRSKQTFTSGRMGASLDNAQTTRPVVGIPVLPVFIVPLLRPSSSTRPPSQPVQLVQQEKNSSLLELKLERLAEAELSVVSVFQPTTTDDAPEVAETQCMESEQSGHSNGHPDFVNNTVESNIHNAEQDFHMEMQSSSHSSSGLSGSNSNDCDTTVPMLVLNDHLTNIRPPISQQRKKRAWSTAESVVGKRQLLAKLLRPPEARSKNAARRRGHRLIRLCSDSSTLDNCRQLNHSRPAKLVSSAPVPYPVSPQLLKMNFSIQQGITPPFSSGSVGSCQGRGLGSRYGSFSVTGNGLRGRSNTFSDLFSLYSEGGETDCTSSLFDSNYCSDSGSESDDDLDVQNEEARPKSALSSDPDRKRRTRLYNICAEIVSTEQKYVEDLKLLSERFPAYIEKYFGNANDKLSDSAKALLQEIKKLLQAVHNYHQQMLSGLNACLGNWEVRKRCSDCVPFDWDNDIAEDYSVPLVLKKYSDFLKSCQPFVEKKNSIADRINDLGSKSAEFRKAVTLFETKHCFGLKLVSYFDVVHMRICRYPLLLQVLLKSTLTGSVEHQRTEETLRKMQQIAMDIERCLFEADKSRKMFELQRRIAGSKFDVVQPGRAFIKEGDLQKHSRKEIQLRHLILFSDVLLYCAPSTATTNGCVVIRNVIQLIDITKVEANFHEQHSSEFSFHARTRSLTFMAISGTEERNEWVEAIEKARADAHHLNLRLSLASRGRTITVGGAEGGQGVLENPAPVEFDLGGSAPIWIPDKKVTKCQSCAAKFNVVIRRHHCRSCGMVICDKCTGKAPLRYLNYAQSKVCPPCFYGIQHKTQGVLAEVHSVTRKFSVGTLDCTDAVEGVAVDHSTDNVESSTLFRKTSLKQVLTSFSGLEVSPAVLLASFIEPSNRKLSHQVSQLSTAESEAETAIIVCSGFLNFQHENKWRSCWVTLKSDSLLEVYEAEKDPVPLVKTTVLGCKLAFLRDSKQRQVGFAVCHKNQFQTSSTPSLVYGFSAANEDLQSKWLHELKKIIKTD